ncbi:MAG: ABC transporter ATP-binding protein [Betaproteobacteria bacterium]|nr:ABC transporter ATP-binding protein [Betaproteobacteria bacterium]
MANIESDPLIVAQPIATVRQFLLQFMGAYKTAAFLGAAVAMSLLDLFGIAIIFPYLQVATSTGTQTEQRVLDWLPNSLSSLDRGSLLLMLSAILIALYVFKSALQVILTRYQYKALSQLTAVLTDDMVSHILRARYATFQKTATSELVGVAYSNTVHATNAFQALTQVLNEALFLGLLLIAFLVAQPMLAILSIFVLALLCAVIYFGVIRRTTALGVALTRIENIRYRLLFSIVSAIRDINIMGLGKLFDDRNREVSAQYAEVAWRHNLNGALPRLAIELVVLVGLVAIASAYILLQLPIEKIAPMIGVAAIASVRTVPGFSRLISSINTYRFSKPVVERLMSVRTNLVAAESRRHDDSLQFNKVIELRGVGFHYGAMQTLSNVNLTIKRGQSIGIVGPSGSGKTTLLDLITGLQPAVEGEFFCDGKLFDPFRSKSIRSMIGYVPQSITLLDESIAFNISFEHQPNPERLQRALRVANLEKFISSIPEGVETLVGENGLRLSGGQRQRIGIARALYRDPAILVFDEATSSLDTISERELTSEIDQLHGHITMIIVTHRLSTIVGCDRIYILSKGTIMASGTHEELLAKSSLYGQLSTSRE